MKNVTIFYNKILRRFSSIIVLKSKKINSFNFNTLRNYLRVKNCNILLVKNNILKLLIDIKENKLSRDLIKGNIMLLYTNNIDPVIKNIFFFDKKL
jgi:ribosomal protein L10